MSQEDNQSTGKRSEADQEASAEIPAPGGQGHSADPVPEAPADALDAVPTAKADLPAEKLPPGVREDLEQARAREEDQ